MYVGSFAKYYVNIYRILARGLAFFKELKTNAYSAFVSDVVAAIAIGMKDLSILVVPTTIVGRSLVFSL